MEKERILVLSGVPNSLFYFGFTEDIFFNDKIFIPEMIK